MSVFIRCRALVLLLLTAGFACAVPALARADRAPTPADVRSLKGQLADASFFRVSTVDPSYVSLHWGARNGAQTVEIDHKVGKILQALYGSGPNEPRDGACAFAPAAIVKDLLGVRCPIWTALHARHAKPTEKALLAKALRTSALTRGLDVPLLGVCISRLDRNWASAVMAFGSTSGIVWFQRRTTKWRSVYETIKSTGVRPSHAIVLSLAACVPYNAGQYGG